MKFTCPCCGYNTLDEEAMGTFEICELCGWEDDAVQNSEPDYEGGANGISLREAQHEFINDNDDTSGYEKSDSWTLLEAPSTKNGIKNSKTDFIVDNSGEVKNAYKALERRRIETRVSIWSSWKS